MAVTSLRLQPGLSLKDREIATVAALTTQGNASSAFKFHCAGMLNTGWSAQEIVETVLHALVYAGFPAVQTALELAREVFDEQNVEFECGTSVVTFGKPGRSGIVPGDASLESEHHHALTQLAKGFANSEIWSRPGLSSKHRQLATLAMVMTKGNQMSAVQLHLQRCLILGWSRTELTELLMQMTAYIGWPMVLAAVPSALEVFERVERNGSPDGEGDQSPVNEQPTELDNLMRSECGITLLNELHPEFGKAFVQGFNDISPDLGRYFVEFFLGEVASRTELDLQTRQLVSIAALAASGRVMDRDSLKFHVKAALNVGSLESKSTKRSCRYCPSPASLPPSKRFQ